MAAGKDTKKWTAKSALEALADGSADRIDLSKCIPIQNDPAGMCQKISDALKTNTACKELILKECNIHNIGMGLLAEGLAANKGLVLLDLSGNKFDSVGVQSVAEGLATNSSLKTLNVMCKAHIGDAALTAWVKTFSTNITITSIIWRLESRKSFAINKLIVRNIEIERRQKAGLNYDDIDPAKRAAYQAPGGAGAAEEQQAPDVGGADEPVGLSDAPETPTGDDVATPTGDDVAATEEEAAPTE